MDNVQQALHVSVVNAVLLVMVNLLALVLLPVWVVPMDMVASQASVILLVILLRVVL